MKQQNKQQKKKVHSIRGQFAWIFIGLMIGTILLCLLLNYMFLGRVYMQSKLDVIHDAYETIKQAAESDSYGSEEFAHELDDVCRSYNMTVCVMDVNSNMKYVSINGGEGLENRLIGYVFGFGTFPDNERIIENGDDYVIQRTGQENKEYLEIYGRLNTGISFIMQTPLSSIQESARIANRFYMMIGCLGALAGGIIIWFVSRRVTKPILELNDISQRMVQLDFEAKYQGRAHNEIDLLGENINKLSDSLEQTISELKTANNELQRDVEKKEAVDEMRKEFLANVSHELKTPLTSMKVLADSLVGQQGVPEELYQEFMSDITAEIDRENKIITDLLSLVKMDKKGQTLNIESMNINNLLEQILKRLRPIAQQKNVEIVMESFRPVTAEIDETKFSLAISNLVENAIKYNRDNGWVHVSLNADHKFFYIKVEDSGIGIPEEDQAYIFERFYRVDKSHSREIGGTGLGLAIARNAVIVHRGSIKVYSAEGEGTTFTVRIPLIYAAS